MAPDEAAFDPVEDEEQDLFEMANLYPRTTGLPVTVWVSPRGGARHDVRIKVACSPADKIDVQDTAIIALRPEPSLVHGDLKAEFARAVMAWASLNTDALVDYRQGDVDTMELGSRLRRLPD